MQSVYGHILQNRQSLFRSNAYQRIKIAVLDTGYDPKQEFFASRDRRLRIKDWKDFVIQSDVPQDDDGHACRVLSLVMKVAPMADVFVIRVAKNSDGLRQSSQIIANVSRALSMVFYLN